MKLYEYQGKELLKKYGIVCPKSILLSSKKEKIPVALPLVVKSQTLSGDRLKAGGIYFASSRQELNRGLQFLGKHISGEEVKNLLIEERIKATKEYYVSFSYSTDTRTPVLALWAKGGSGISKAHVVPIDLTAGLPGFLIRQALKDARFPGEDIGGVIPVAQNLWNLFLNEHALLAEINPLFKDREGKFIAGDAKIVLDDEKIKPQARRFLEMGGDIAVLASGGGASLINVDALLYYGGKPANYTEYSGNPPKEVVRELTKRVLGQKNLKGCWVIGGTANFTDIFETMKGFIEGLREVKPKATYPIVIRRDGPRQKEAFEMLRKIAADEGYDFHLYNSETPMSETARIMVKLAYAKSINPALVKGRKDGTRKPHVYIR